VCRVWGRERSRSQVLQGVRLSALPGPTAVQAALDTWMTAQLSLDHAFATLCALHVLPAGDVSEADVRSARTYLEERRAVALLRLFDAADGATHGEGAAVSTP